MASVATFETAIAVPHPDRREARMVARDFDAVEPRLGLFGEPDCVVGVPNPRVGSKPHPFDQPGDEEHRDERCAELDQIVQAHLPPASASSIGRRPERS